MAATGYISHMSAIRDPGLAQLFAQISADEVIHWTTLNSATGGSLPAEPFEFGCSEEPVNGAPTGRWERRPLQLNIGRRPMGERPLRPGAERRSGRAEER